jgi:bacilysin biosynthesis protein BacA
MLINPGNDPLYLGVLGPKNTSSEAIGKKRIANLADSDRNRIRLRLFESFDSMRSSLDAGQTHWGIVPAAWRGFNDFAFDPALKLEESFEEPTPEYGLARRKGDLDPLSRENATVATHPAPVPLLKLLLPICCPQPKVKIVSSTSVAAEELATGKVDAAITNAEALNAWDLEWIAKYGQIPMVWAVFRSCAAN